MGIFSRPPARTLMLPRFTAFQNPKHLLKQWDLGRLQTAECPKCYLDKQVTKRAHLVPKI